MTNEALNPQLEGMERELRKSVPIAAYDLLRQSVEELRRQGSVEGMKIGEFAPGFALAGAAGQEVSLLAEVAKGPVVLVFYRGGWCPFCNMQLRAYERVLPGSGRLALRLSRSLRSGPTIRSLNGRRGRLTFGVASDPDGRVAERYAFCTKFPKRFNASCRNSEGAWPNTTGRTGGCCRFPRYSSSSPWRDPVSLTSTRIS